MGSVPTPRTFAAGEIETAAYLNSLGAVLKFMQNPPRCCAYAASNTNLNNNAFTTINLDAEAYDTDGMHDVTLANSYKVTAQTSGLYLAILQVQFANVNTGSRATMLRKNSGGNSTNGTLIATSQDVNGGNLGSIFTISADVYLAAGDTLEAFAYQNSGAALTPGVDAGAGATFMSVRWVAVS